MKVMKLLKISERIDNECLNRMQVIHFLKHNIYVKNLTILIVIAFNGSSMSKFTSQK